MATIPDLLKRKRARPSDWWVASPSQSTPPHTSEPPLKKRDTKPLGGGGPTIKQVIGAANRSKVAKAKDDPAVKRGRAGKEGQPGKHGSNAGKELVIKEPLTAASQLSLTNRSGPPSIADQDVPTGVASKSTNVLKKKRRPHVAQVDELAEVKTSRKVQRRKGTLPASPSDELAASDVPGEDVGRAKPLSRGRSSNDGAAFQDLIAASKKNSQTQNVRGMDIEGKESLVAQPTEAVASGLNSKAEKRKKLSGANDAQNRASKILKRADAGLSTVNGPTEPKKSERRVVERPLRKQLSEPTARMRRARASSPRQAGRSTRDMDGDKSRQVKGRRTDDVSPDKEAVPAVSQLPAYQHLTAVTRRVPRHTIESRWEPLTKSCIERISQFLYDIQRPVVVQFDDERKRNQASTAVELISRRLVGKLSKGLPFPSGTRNHREDDFDFEKILDLQRGFETQLTPAIHANELLQIEIGKEAALLELEQMALAGLETNAKAEAVKRKQAGRKLHPLLHSEKSGTEEEDLQYLLRLDDKASAQPLDLMVQDEDLKTVLHDLNGHVDTIQANRSQVSGITEAITKSRAAVQATLLDHLERTLYEGVILG